MAGLLCHGSQDLHLCLSLPSWQHRFYTLPTAHRHKIRVVHSNEDKSALVPPNCFFCQWCFLCAKHRISLHHGLATHKGQINTVHNSTSAYALLIIIAQWPSALVAVPTMQRSLAPFARLIVVVLATISIAIVGNLCQNSALLNKQTNGFAPIDQTTLFCPGARFTILLHILPSQIHRWGEVRGGKRGGGGS